MYELLVHCSRVMDRGQWQA